MGSSQDSVRSFDSVSSASPRSGSDAQIQDDKESEVDLRSGSQDLDGAMGDHLSPLTLPQYPAPVWLPVEASLIPRRDTKRTQI